MHNKLGKVRSCDTKKFVPTKGKVQPLRVAEYNNMMNESSTVVTQQKDSKSNKHGSGMYVPRQTLCHDTMETLI